MKIKNAPLLVLVALLFPLGMLKGQSASTAPTPAAAHAPRAATPVPKTEKQNWMPQHENNVALARKGGIDLLFVGDSITRCWSREPGIKEWSTRFAPLHAANFGISGDCTEHVLWRLQNGELENIHPKAIVLLIGTNNITGGDSPADIAQAVGAIVGEFASVHPVRAFFCWASCPGANSPTIATARPSARSTVSSLVCTTGIMSPISISATNCFSPTAA